MPKPSRRLPSPPSLGASVAIAAASFMAALAVLLLLVYKAQALVALGMAGNLFYIVLVPLGLSVAAFLFGILRSRAAYAGKPFGGTLELSGPPVVFFLVVVLGFNLIPSPQVFALTVFVHGESGRQDLLLRNEGSVLLFVGSDLKREPIGIDGQAKFMGIPGSFRGQKVPVAIDAEGYELATENVRISLDAESADIAVRAKPALLIGYVREENSQPIADATVSVVGATARTDSTGFFRLTLSGAVLKKDLAVQVTAPGYGSWFGTAVPGSNELVVILARRS
jgi:hypothetical protein